MKRILLFSGFLFIALTVVKVAEAQFFKKLVDEVSDRVEDKIIDDAGDAAVKGVDKTENAIGGATTTSANNSAKTNEEGFPTEQGKKVTGKDQKIPAKPGRGEVNAYYDFKPGERTLFAIDFTKEKLGNFPRKLEFIGGNFSVVEWKGERFAQVKDGQARFAIQLSEKLPERFTIQLKLFDPYWLREATITTTEEVDKGQSYFRIYNRGGVGVITRDGPSSTGDPDPITKGVVPIEIMVDGSYAKMYVNGLRVANIPNANIKRTDKLFFSIGAGSSPKDFAYITDIRIAAGGISLYQTLEAEGRVAIHDIHFATGKAKVLPGSSETIGKVARLLDGHPDLKLLIEGHTDNTGDFEKNMQLSKDRAAAVKTYLIQKFKIDGERLQTMGLGQSRPVADNDTEEGRAKNRRVEIVKL